MELWEAWEEVERSNHEVIQMRAELEATKGSCGEAGTQLKWRSCEHA